MAIRRRVLERLAPARADAGEGERQAARFLEGMQSPPPARAGA